ncbi:MAG: hypothetical protein A2268_00620 [Candidatus Raymondbacteria bacterium RifOxyA12_full_50_37]|uniref:Secretion system C-terminal sorting domain-containing protein n=1 Tax=Candidatus Raymondbacteria bacterium RIFOXYD12_FULL_49_13 TaxID=1817890 RepID=A0A1F7F1L9_UNCRA|nr:MAG: hypothetical protein A2350_20395 [Candidatus Raymondbacteria bacterium RifOxyB12_full_50_8]OGJ90660.1 MAG: hypothetical protein A2268_00620 [Candidatus Raymondbacteria bacterium RifOxyA12_full_50_37]OGJ92003.1 MAG: hypothetical protein A2248_15680 [Candidatus Raymondbacteria bacterium RIFOXYA2_FULL_49_16]OGK00396.1 MAG: hypothetical protein A2519_01175 [Candidatus Raymondbacteria bacterium RIFOXYD12_FULL_49_13]OGK04810.1 MAG: hypothetical protein A2487_11565 [Candidatus Raymondbacteria 
MCLAILAISVFGYFPVSKILPMENRYRNLDYYPNYSPACTLNLALNSRGASGYLDAHFTAPVSGMGLSDSCEVLSVLCLPRHFSVDSMVLWVNNEPQPARLLSIGQAEATYDNIVYVTRQDPAYVRRINGYPDNYGFYPYRPYENQFEVKIYPCVLGQSRHVRIFLDCHADISAGFSTIDLGHPMGSVVRINTQSNVTAIPTVNRGVLSLFSTQDRIGYQITETDTHSLVFTTGSVQAPVSGCAGVVQTVDSGANYFKLQLDLAKLFNLDQLAQRRKVTFVWVPSSSLKTSAINYYEEEKDLISNYIAGFKVQEYLNFVYAGDQVEMFEPHMVAAGANVITRAQSFLSSRIDPEQRSLYTRTFPALVKAFSSIASSDTPAVVFCMDREPAMIGGPASDNARLDSMKNVLVQINVNKTKFYAWVHWSKAFFYSRVASALNGSISWYDPSAGYHSPYTTSATYDFTFIDRAFGPGPSISSHQIRLDDNCFNVITSRQISGYDLPGPNPCTRIDLLGQCSAGYLSGTVTASIGGQLYERPFIVTSSGNTATGLNLDKLWAFDMVEVFAEDQTFFSWAPRRSYTLSNSLPEFNLSGTILRTADTYRKMVEISLQNQVVTGASALLALEPGMEYLDTDRFDDQESGPLTAIETAPAKADSLKASLVASPNPFNPTTNIALVCGNFTGMAAVYVYDATGRLVHIHKAMPINGRVAFTFNARDSHGMRLASGVYMIKAVFGNRCLQTKAMLLK